MHGMLSRCMCRACCCGQSCASVVGCRCLLAACRLFFGHASAGCGLQCVRCCWRLLRAAVLHVILAMLQSACISPAHNSAEYRRQQQGAALHSLLLLVGPWFPSLPRPRSCRVLQAAAVAHPALPGAAEPHQPGQV